MRLGDGTFDGATGLEPWTLYGVRARHRDDSDSCSAWSEWSEVTAIRTDDGSTNWFGYFPHELGPPHEVAIELSPESYASIDS